jgi:hypothetical protein
MVLVFVLSDRLARALAHAIKSSAVNKSIGKVISILIRQKLQYPLWSCIGLIVKNLHVRLTTASHDGIGK